MMGFGSSLAYMASKGALNAMTIGMARAFGPAVRVNAIAPGLVETPWLQKGLGAERYAAAVKFYKDRSALDAVMTPGSSGNCASRRRPNCASKLLLATLAGRHASRA